MADPGEEEKANKDAEDVPGGQQNYRFRKSA